MAHQGLDPWPGIEPRPPYTGSVESKPLDHREVLSSVLWIHAFLDLIWDVRMNKSSGVTHERVSYQFTFDLGGFSLRSLAQRFNILPTRSSIQASALLCCGLNQGVGELTHLGCISHPPLSAGFQLDKPREALAGDWKAGRGWLSSHFLSRAFTITCLFSLALPGPRPCPLPGDLCLRSPATHLFPLPLSEWPHWPLFGFSALPSHGQPILF